MMQDYDIIIVGGGVSGCRLAQELADKGLDILIIEKDRQIKLKDSGIVSSKFMDFFGSKDVIHEICEMDIVPPSGKNITISSPRPFAFIIDRERFSRRIRKEAKKSAKINFEFVRSVKITPYAAMVSTNKAVYNGKIIIGADGASSATRRSLGIKSPKLYAGLLVRTPNKIKDNNGNEYNKINVFMNKFYSPDFFSWVIPQIKEYGLITAHQPTERFDYFKKKLKLPEGDFYKYPIASGFTNSYTRRALLIGEACGANKPLTAGGIVFSLNMAKIAAGVILEAFDNKDFTKTGLASYENRWKTELLDEIGKQQMFRKFYRKMSNRDIDTMFDYIRPHTKSIRDFDYDKLSELYRYIPRWKLLKFILPRIRYLI